MKAFQWSAASLLSVLCTFSVSVQAAPGGVSFNDAGLWLKTDDAGDIAVAWKDNSGASNNVEVRVTGSAAPWALSEADAAHNFHPYTTGYQNNRLFHDTDASFVEEGDNVTPLTMIAVTRLVSLPDTDSVARITGLANSSLPEAAEPGLSVAGDDSDYAADA